jgi:hypothetical protein
MRRTARPVAFEPLERRDLLATVEGSVFALAEAVDAAGLSGDLSASIAWGDGTESDGAVSGGVDSPLTARIDYSLDTNGFFAGAANQIRRDLVQRAADVLVSKLGDDLKGISPGGANSWTAVFNHPSTGVSHSIGNMTIEADELVIFVGARELGGSLGSGGPGGYTVRCASGSSFCDDVATRGESGAAESDPTDFGPWGGFISFDTTTNWHFGQTTQGQSNGESDFLSVAIHEIAHVLGFGASNSWSTFRSGLIFNGTASRALYGSGVPLSSGGGHWANGTMSNEQETAMDPSLTTGTRKLMTDLDLAGLDDIGWQLIDTSATVSANHTYADDGTYDIDITLSGTSGGSATKGVQETISNAIPILTAASGQTVAAGEPFTITDIASFMDPGFGANETFTYSIDWGDGTSESSGDATIDQAGSAGTVTRGSFDGSHTYSANDDYTVTVSVEDDDGGSDSETLEVTALASLSVSNAANEIREDAGAAATTVEISRGAADSSAPLVVSLRSDSTEVSLPLTATIPAGDSSVTVDVAAVDDNLLDGTQTVPITASAAGFFDGTGTLDVTDYETLSIVLAHPSVSENAGAIATIGTVTRSNTDNQSAIVVTLSSDDTTTATVPNQVAIPAGQASAGFNIGVIDNSLLQGTRSATILASASGYEDGFVSLVVTDHETLTLAIAEDSIGEDAGADATIATVTRNNTNIEESLTVTISSDRPDKVMAPVTVSIAANEVSATFSLDAVDDSLLDGIQLVTLTASATGYIDGLDTLDVTDAETLALEIIDESIVESAGLAAATAVITRNNTNLDEPLVVNLVSDDTSEAAVGLTVTIPAGEDSTSFTVDAVDDALLDGVQPVMLIASAPGYVSSASDTLDVLDHETLTVTIDSIVIVEGSSAVATVSRSNTNVDVPLTVDIAIDDITEATVPESVTIPTGQHSASFGIDALDDGLDDGIQAALLTASAGLYDAADVAFEVTDPLWQNPVNPVDVDADGHVVALDALLIINELNETGTRLLQVPTAQIVPPFLDVDSDGYVSPTDALLVINVLNGPLDSGEGESSPNDTNEQTARVKDTMCRVAELSRGSSVEKPRNHDQVWRTEIQPLAALQPKDSDELLTALALDITAWWMR